MFILTQQQDYLKSDTYFLKMILRDGKTQCF